MSAIGPLLRIGYHQRPPRSRRAGDGVPAAGDVLLDFRDGLRQPARFDVEGQGGRRGPGPDRLLEEACGGARGRGRAAASARPRTKTARALRSTGRRRKNSSRRARCRWRSSCRRDLARATVSSHATKPTPKVQLLADVSDPIAPQMVQGLLQKVSFTAAPDMMATEGMGMLEKYGGPLTPSPARVDGALGEIAEGRERQPGRQEPRVEHRSGD